MTAVVRPVAGKLLRTSARLPARPKPAGATGGGRDGGGRDGGGRDGGRHGGRHGDGGHRGVLRRRAWAAACLVATVVALLAAGLGHQDVVKPDGGVLVAEFFGAALHPRLDSDFLALVGNATVTTVSYAVLGTVLGVIIGLVGGVLMSQTWWMWGRRGKHGRWGWLVCRGALAVPRGIHEVVWGLFFLAVFGLEPIVAVLAIGLPSGAVTAKVFSELLDEAHQGPYRALLGAGAGRPAGILYGLLPGALSDLLSYAFYRFECAIRSATILGLVGAGGLGFQLALSFQSLRYGEIWTLLFALILLSAAADFWSSAVRRRRARPRPAGPVPDRLMAGSFAAIVALVPLSALWVGLDMAVLWSGRTWDLLFDLAATAWPPSTGDGGVPVLVEYGWVTLAMSIVAGAVAFWGGALLAFPAAHISPLGRRTKQRPVARSARLLVLLASRGLLIVLRAIPPPVWALLFLFVLFPGILPGALALGVYTIGVLGRLMAETTENLDGRSLRALRTHGASEMQVFCYAVIPAATPRFVAYGLYRWEVVMRETIVVGVVGAGGLGLLLDQQLATFDYAATVSTLIAMIVLTFAVDMVSASVRRSLR